MQISEGTRRSILVLIEAGRGNPGGLIAFGCPRARNASPADRRERPTFRSTVDRQRDGDSAIRRAGCERERRLALGRDHDGPRREVVFDCARIRRSGTLSALWIRWILGELRGERNFLVDKRPFAGCAYCTFVRAFV